ncbi:uncharacterized protein LOC135809268 [Sycon ciliatum]|uniref:uncharacterized protein LOC135809268 n=1 Tax=Sycon ciliatum TaxID=27933 RepID=UPI0031F6D5E1
MASITELPPQHRQRNGCRMLSLPCSSCQCFMQTGNPNELQVTWISSDGQDQDPTLWYRSNAMSHTEALRQQPSAISYSPGDICGESDIKLLRDPGIIYSAVMTDLTPNTAYTYWYGFDNTSSEDILSPKRAITSPQPTTNTGQQTTCRMIAFADMGVWLDKHLVNWQSKPVVDLIQRMINNTDKRIDMIAHIIDIPYTDATSKKHVWEKFFYHIESIATLVPYHVAIGHGEYDHTSTPSSRKSKGVETQKKPTWSNYGNNYADVCGVPMAERFPMPQSPGSNGVFWYGVNVANVHFVMISTEHDLSPGSVQLNWLRYDLSAVNRATQPWVIVAGHRPLYNNEKRQKDDDLPVQLKLREILNPVFAEFDVNLYVCGHYHNYVRTTPISRNGSVTSVGTVHITVGTGGADLGSGQYHSVPWVAKNLTTFGVISIETVGPERMIVQFVSSSGTVLDSTILNLPSKPSTTQPHVTGISAGSSDSLPSTYTVVLTVHTLCLTYMIMIMT